MEERKEMIWLLSNPSFWLSLLKESKRRKVGFEDFINS